MSYAERYRLLIATVFRAAEQNRDEFNYQEALAAMNAKLLILPPP